MKFCATPYCKRKAVVGRRFCGTCHTTKWRESHPLEATFRSRKDNAKRRGIEWAMTLQEFKELCDESGYLEGRGLELNSLTLDRKKAWLGYTKENTQVITMQANGKKGATERRTPPGYNPWPETPF